MDNYYQKRSVGKIIACILVAVLLVAAVGAIVVFTRKDKPAEEKPMQEYNESIYYSLGLMQAIGVAVYTLLNGVGT